MNHGGRCGCSGVIRNATTAHDEYESDAEADELDANEFELISQVYEQADESEAEGEQDEERAVDAGGEDEQPFGHIVSRPSGPVSAHRYARTGCRICFM